MDMKKETTKALETVQAQVNEMKQTEQVIIESMGDGNKQPQKKEGSFDIKIPKIFIRLIRFFDSFSKRAIY